MTYRLYHSQLPPPTMYWHNGGAPHPSEVGYLQHHAPAYAGPPRNRKLSTSTITRENRKYIDPWDLENFEYIHRASKTSPEPMSPTDSSMAMQSPAGEPVASTFFYVPADPAHGDSIIESDQDDDDVEAYEDRPHELRMHPANDDVEFVDNHNHFDCTTGCYAGLDEELFYNAKYESIHDDPAYSLYYTDLESSSTERTSSCGGSSVSTLQLHTPGFGVRASGRRSIVLPKPEPHIEFPPAPPAHEFYAGFLPVHHHNHHHHEPMITTSRRRMSSQSRMPMSPPVFNDVDLEMPYQTLGRRHPASASMGGGGSSESNTYCSLAECAYDCVPDHVPVYAISNPATMRRRNATIAGSPPVLQPPNNFGLSKRGLLQIDYSFNWNNLHRFISK